MESGLVWQAFGDRCRRWALCETLGNGWKLLGGLLVPLLGLGVIVMVDDACLLPMVIVDPWAVTFAKTGKMVSVFTFALQARSLRLA